MIHFLRLLSTVTAICAAIGGFIALCAAGAAHGAPAIILTITLATSSLIVGLSAAIWMFHTWWDS